MSHHLSGVGLLVIAFVVILGAAHAAAHEKVSDGTTPSPSAQKHLELLTKSEVWLDRAIKLYETELAKKKRGGGAGGGGGKQNTQETITVDGKQYTARQAIIESINLNPKNFDAWQFLAAQLMTNNPDDKVRLGGLVPYDRVGVFAQAVKLNQNHADTWVLLGEALTQRVNEAAAASAAASSNADPVEKAKELYQMGHVIFRSEDDDVETALSARECFIQALRNDPRHGGAWLMLGNDFKIADDGKTMEVLHRDYSRKELYANAVRYTQGKNPAAWYNLGLSFESRDDSVEIEFDDEKKKDDGKEMYDDDNKSNRRVVFKLKDVFVEALNLAPDFAFAWEKLTSVLVNGDDHVVVRGEKLTKKQCEERGRKNLDDTFARMSSDL